MPPYSFVCLPIIPEFCLFAFSFYTKVQLAFPIPYNLFLSMASALKTCDEVLKKLDACQIQHMARMHEGLICQAIADYGPSSRIFVRSHDGGSNDCGLYLGEDPLPDDLTAKLFQQSTGLQRGRVILPMDIKSFGWCVDTHGGLYHTFHLTRKQCKTCQVLLLGSALDPNLVAVLPTSCLNPKGQLKKKTEDPIDFYFTLRWQFSLLQAPAFPPAFAPAVVPISQLGEMMIRLAAWMKGESDIWSAIPLPIMRYPTRLTGLGKIRTLGS